jgi:hypothetical protein
MVKMTPYQVHVAAEAFAAGAVAHGRCNVSVQYAANQPDYDLLAERKDRILKIQVKGSQDGKWGLTQSHMKNKDYHGAADKWLAKQGRKTVYVLVQFKDVEPGQAPRLYLVTPREIATQLKQSRQGHGVTILYEYKKWSGASVASGTVDCIPKSWLFSQARLDAFFERYARTMQT